MKIVENHTKDKVIYFGDLLIGDCFRPNYIVNETISIEDVMYMKVKDRPDAKYNCVCLNDGITTNSCEDLKVIKYDATLHITKGK
jgi:hypothetical protein